MIDMVVALAIITAISAQVLINFSGLNDGAALHRAGQELALNLRKVQNMALEVAQIEGQTTQSPPGVGIHLSTNSTGYPLFADYTHDFFYSTTIGSHDIPLPNATVQFSRNVKIKELKAQDGTIYGDTDIIFSAPEAVMTITRPPTPLLPLAQTNMLTITLEAPSGQTQKIIVRTSGQISIK